MIFGILFVIIVIGIFFAISIYIYDNSEFRKVTGYSFATLLKDHDKKELYKVVRIIHNSSKNCKVLFNLGFSYSPHIIDALILHPSGIYVLNVKRSNGWVFGRENDVEWAEALQREKVIKFKNPLEVNKKAILEIKQYLPDYNLESFCSLVVFNNSCSFKNIEVNSKNSDVLKTNELKSFWKNKNNEILSKEDLSKIYVTLEKYMNFKLQDKELEQQGVVQS